MMIIRCSGVMGVREGEGSFKAWLNVGKGMALGERWFGFWVEVEVELEVGDEGLGLGLDGKVMVEVEVEVEVMMSEEDGSDGPERGRRSCWRNVR